jgi:CRP-like cAMP-binding protein
MAIDKTRALETFYKQFTPRNYRKGETIIRADDDPQGIFCLSKGYVRQYTISKTGFELTLHILKPISYFPMIWAINDTPNAYSFEALTATEVRRAPKDQVISFIKDNPTSTFALMSVLLEDYAETLTRVEHLVSSDAYRRVISVLLYIAKHFGERKGDSIIVSHHFTQLDIATFVGVARQTANNEMIKLEKKGLIKYIGHSMRFDDIKKLSLELSSTNAKL